jgi:hypothetical protein
MCKGVFPDFRGEAGQGKKKSILQNLSDLVIDKPFHQLLIWKNGNGIARTKVRLACPSYRPLGHL